jgi:transposase
MPVGRPVSKITLSDEERSKLVDLARRRKTSQAVALRAQIVLACAEGLNNGQVAKKFRLSLPTVGKWRRRFAQDRLAGMADAPRPGQPRNINDAKVEEVVTRTLESVPKDATQWSTRSMAKASGLTQNAILRIWRAFALKPHLERTFKPVFYSQEGITRVKCGILLRN